MAVYMRFRLLILNLFMTVIMFYVNYNKYQSSLNITLLPVHQKTFVIISLWSGNMAGTATPANVKM